MDYFTTGLAAIKVYNYVLTNNKGGGGDLRICDPFDINMSQQNKKRDSDTTDTLATAYLQR